MRSGPGCESEQVCSTHHEEVCTEVLEPSCHTEYQVGGDKCGADTNLEYSLQDVEEEVCAPVQDEVCTTQYEEECRTEPGECSAQEETECRIELPTNLREV